MFHYRLFAAFSEAASDAVVHKLLTGCFKLLQLAPEVPFCTQTVDRKFQTVASQWKSP